MSQQEIPTQRDKKLGWGSISLLLFLCGFLFSFSFGKYDALGDSVLNSVGISAWSNGDTGVHYTVFYSLFIYIVAWVVGFIFKNDWGAKAGRVLSFVLFMMLSFMFLLIL